MSSREEKPLGLNIGSASIIMVFTVLCLTVFSVLAFVSAASEYKTAQRFAESTKSYYEAEANALASDGSVLQTVKWQEENVIDWEPDAEMEVIDPDTIK